MAGETTTATAVDSQFPKWFDSMITEELRPLSIPREFLKYRGKESAPVYRFTFLGDPGAAAAQTEGSSMTNTSLSTSGVDVTVGTIGMAATITKQHDELSLYDTYSTYGSQLVRSVQEKFDTDYAGVIDNFNNSTGTSGVDVVLTDAIEASAAIAARDVKGQLVMVLHTRQIADLKLDASTSLASAAPMIGETNAADLGSYQGTYHGIPAYQSSLVNTANAGADRAGAMFAVNDAIGLYEVWAPASGRDEDITLPGTQIAVTACYGIGVIRDSAGQKIVTDA